MFGLDPKLLAQLPPMLERLEAAAGAWLLELRRLNDNLEALRRDGVPLKPPAPE